MGEVLISILFVKLYQNYLKKSKRLVQIIETICLILSEFLKSNAIININS